LRRLGSPENRIPHYLHIGGTNGKGSVAAMIESMLRQGGQTTGFFSSPHLSCHRERYRRNNLWLSEPQFAAILTRIAPEITTMVAEGWESPTEFELATACALLYFSYAGVDWAIMEVGMGGAIDSTNVIDGEIAVITNVALDHCAYLGHTVAEIARVKAGIIKTGATVISGVSGEAVPLIDAVCGEKSARLLLLGRDIVVENPRPDQSGSYFDLHTPGHYYQDLRVNLAGRHQIDNAALAVAGAEQVGCDPQAIARGLAGACWPGRLEILRRHPLVVVDGAHNPHGMAALAEALRGLWPGRRRVALVGMLADKERQEALSMLIPQIDQAIITPPPYLSRVGDWQELARICAAANLPTTAVEDNAKALELALSCTGTEDLLIVTGSLYLIAAMRELLGEHRQGGSL
ncbi:MAG: folylpolyglutamate synthase/dihydrofolate synthase family protein, partial [Clostridiales bacterium]